jgi:hypothetical protein
MALRSWARPTLLVLALASLVATTTADEPPGAMPHAVLATDRNSAATDPAAPPARQNMTSAASAAYEAALSAYLLMTADPLGAYPSFEPDRVLAKSELVGLWRSCTPEAASKAAKEAKEAMNGSGGGDVAGCVVQAGTTDRTSFFFSLGDVMSAHQAANVPILNVTGGVSAPTAVDITFDTVTFTGGFTVLYKCGPTEPANPRASVVEMTVTVTNMHNIIFRWVKMCESGTHKMLDIGYVPADSKEEHSLLLNSSAAKTGLVVSPTLATTDMFMSIRLPAPSIDYHAPVVTSSNKSVCSVATRGEADGGTLVAGDPARFSIMYTCVGRGHVTVDVSVDVPPWDPLRTVSFVKDCGGGLAENLAIGTVNGLDDVVRHGNATAKYRPALQGPMGHWDPVIQSPHVSAAEHTSKFVLQNFGKKSTESIRVTRALLTVSDSTILRVLIEGDLGDPLFQRRSSSQLEPGGSKRLVLHYVCLRAGRAAVTVSLPMVRFTTVEFSLVKECETPRVREARSLFNVTAIEDLCFAVFLVVVFGCLVVRRIRRSRTGSMAARVYVDGSGGGGTATAVTSKYQPVSSENNTRSES